jgi:FAD/FMN-containing dehydrogenase
MTDRSIPIGSRDVARLRRRFQGQVLLPGQGGYDQARRVWNAMVDRHSAVIARCAGPADVAAAVRFARAHGLELGVRCGGHSVLGLSVPDGGLMVDLSPLGPVRVDPERRRAWVAGGALLGDLDRATQPYGLATTAGNVSHTGVGGLTLGGGMGWLARRFGLACDNVARFQLVTAEGELLHASEREHPDLCWGLRGGGGNFGVVTEFEFALHQVGTAALLVDLFYTPQDAPAALRRWRELLPDAPPQATLTAWVGTTGPWSFLAPALVVQAAGQRRLRLGRRPGPGARAAARASGRDVAAGGRAGPGALLPGAADHGRRGASPWAAAALVEGPLPARARRRRDPGLPVPR